MADNVSRRGRARPSAGRFADHGSASLYAANGARKYLNADERRRLLAAVEGLPLSQALFVQTLAWTGARVSEVLALRPDSFQITESSVALRTLKRRRHSMREVPIPPELIAALERHFQLERMQRDPSAVHRPLWPWCRQTAWRIIKRLMTDAGIDGPRACPRGLRHAFCVGALSAGVPLNLVSRWAGHAMLSTTAIYTNVSGPEEIAFAARFWGAEDANSDP